MIFLSTIHRASRGIARVKVEAGQGTVLASNQHQTWDGILSGGERLLTMSCSDKIARWNVLGLQGSLLTHYIEPIYLKSITVGQLFNYDHLTRALYTRVCNLSSLPDSFIVNYPLLLGISKPPRRNVAKPSSLSLNWSWGDSAIEIVNSRTGKVDDTKPSRLCKQCFYDHFLRLWDMLPGDQVRKCQLNFSKKEGLPAIEREAMSVEIFRNYYNYAEVKDLAWNYRDAKSKLNTHFKTFLGSFWIKKPLEQNCFKH